MLCAPNQRQHREEHLPEPWRIDHHQYRYASRQPDSRFTSRASDFRVGDPLQYCKSLWCDRAVVQARQLGATLEVRDSTLLAGDCKMISLAISLC